MQFLNIRTPKIAISKKKFKFLPLFFLFSIFPHYLFWPIFFPHYFYLSLPALNFPLSYFFLPILLFTQYLYKLIFLPSIFPHRSVFIRWMIVNGSNIIIRPLCRSFKDAISKLLELIIFKLKKIFFNKIFSLHFCTQLDKN